MTHALRVLDLFAGLGGWSQAFRARGHRVTTLDIEPAFQPTVCVDILAVTPQQLGGADAFDVVLASPPCTGFSVASIGHHWTKTRDHNHVPKTQEARQAVSIVQATLSLIAALRPRYWFLENPRGKLRKLPFMKPHRRVTVGYCAYGQTYQKPSDIWGRFPAAWRPKPLCEPGSPCHEAAPRGSKFGVQGVQPTGPGPTGLSKAQQIAALRAIVPHALSLEVCVACEQGDAPQPGQQELLAGGAWT